MVDGPRPTEKTGRISLKTRVLGDAAKLAGFCRSLPDRAQGYAFDRFPGVSTWEPDYTTGAVFQSGEENCPYTGTQWIPIRRALKDLAPESSDVFVDLGAGKGKVLLIAARFQFRQAIGVEIDENLCRYAARNVEAARSRLHVQLVETVNANVLEWAIPDDVSVVFLFNPFIGETFRSAIERLFESYDRKPRDLRIIYEFPWEHDWLISTDRVSVEDVRPSTWPARPGWWRRGDVMVSYRVAGASEGCPSAPSRGRSLARNRAFEYWSRSNGCHFALSAPGHETLFKRST